jgi:hypothetical protein
MHTVEELIANKKILHITFKDGAGKYHNKIQMFNTVDEYEHYCESRMKTHHWKEIGTEEWKREKK